MNAKPPNKAFEQDCPKSGFAIFRPASQLSRWASINQGVLNMRSSFLLFIAFLSPAAIAQGNESLSSATDAYLAKRGDGGHPERRTFQFDLNGDGREDAIVLLTGNRWCGSGGCNMLVFQGTDEGFSLISNSTITNVPIAVLPETMHGWHTLIVRSGGTGAVLMRFNGHR